MIKTTSICVRPSIETPFFIGPVYYRFGQATKYPSMKKEVTYSDDGLTETITVIFASKEDFDKFEADQDNVNLKVQRNRYNEDHNITRTWTIEEL